MKLGRLNHIGVATQPEPLPGGEGLGWGLYAMSRAQRQTPTPLRLRQSFDKLRTAKSRCPSPAGRGEVS